MLTTHPSDAAYRADASYAAYVNRQWVRLLDVLDMNVRYTGGTGEELVAEGGATYLDFLSGYGVYNVGHGHPRLIADLQAELERGRPGMLQSHVPELAGDLAETLCQRAGGRLRRVFFTSSGSEGIETVIKFARAHTHRHGILFASGAFHGLTCGALSLMDTPFWTAGFGPGLPGTHAVPFGHVEALAEALATERYAAVVLEPIQAEGGIRVPDPHYLRMAQAMCARHGTLLVLDEVQTGLGRTGSFLAAHQFLVDPDMVVLAKALSGGFVPVGAVLMSEAVHDSVYDSIDRAFVHASTFGENTLAMRAALTTLAILDDEDLARRAAALGGRFRADLADALAPFDMVEDVRGVGLLCGIAFRPPSRLALRVPFALFERAHAGLFGQMVVKELFGRHRILTQVCGNDFRVLKVAPPLVTRRASLDRFVAAIRDVVADVHASPRFWAEALALAARALAV